MFAIQMVISVVQALTAISSSVMTCKAICSCCRSKRDSGVVYYRNDRGATTATNVSSQPLVLPQQRPGYITIPSIQIQSTEAAGASAIHGGNILPGNMKVEAETPPPKYESVVKGQNLDIFDGAWI